MSGEQVRIDPCLPAAWRKVAFSIGFRGDRYHFVVTPENVRVKVDSARKKTIDTLVRDRKVTVDPQEWEAIELKKGEP